MIECYICGNFYDRRPCMSDHCEGLRTERAARQLANPNEVFISFGTVPGGASPLEGHRLREEKFAKGLHAYREARRAGEQPEDVTVDGVRKARQKQEVKERVEKKLEKGMVEPV